MIELHNVTGDKIFVNEDKILHLEQFEGHSNLYLFKGYSISVKETIETIVEKVDANKK